MTINVDILDPASVQAAIAQLESYDLEARVDEICRRIADIGFATASAGFAGAIYDGTNDVRVTVEPIDNGYAVKANGQAVLFMNTEQVPHSATDIRDRKDMAPERTIREAADGAVHTDGTTAPRATYTIPTATHRLPPCTTRNRMRCAM